MRVKFLILLAVTMSAMTVFADEFGKWRFNTIEAKRALRLYERQATQERSAYKRATQAIESARRDRMSTLRGELLASFEAAKEKALVGKDLDEAVALNAAIEKIKQGKDLPGAREQPDEPAQPAVEQPAPAASDATDDVVKRLTNTTWLLVEKGNKDGWVTFLPNNVLKVNYHRNGGMWAVIDNRTVRFTPWAGDRAIIEWRVDGQGRLISVRDGVVVRQLRR